MRGLIREPLVHFVLAAGLIFVAYSVASAGRAGEAETIHVSAAELERLAALYAAEAGTLPSPEDLRAIVVDHVENEALAREARRLGLGEGDTVVERRLAQKMRFMLDDLAELPTPEETELRTWYTQHSERFTEPGRVSFDHVFLATPDDTRSAALLAQLNGNAPPDWRRSGDPFMLQRQYGNLPVREVIRLFGGDFAEALSALPVSDTWQGPVPSAIGVHLLRVSSRSPEKLPAFDNIREAVEADWETNTRRRLNAEAVAEVVGRYEVEIEGLEP